MIFQNLFSAEDLEWEFGRESDRDELEFSNRNKTVKNVGEYGASIKLKNKTINNDREYNITIKSEIKDDDLLAIGVCDCENWDKQIDYYHGEGNIIDNGENVKKLEKKLKRGYSLKIKDTFYGKINDKKVFKVSIHINQEKLFATFYCAEERKTLRLGIGSKIQLEVNVKGKILINY